MDVSKMWRVGQNEAFPFRPKHVYPNHFPPPPPKRLHERAKLNLEPNPNFRGLVEVQRSSKTLYERPKLNIDRLTNPSVDGLTKEQPSPKRLHERPTLNLDLYRSLSAWRRMEEVPIVFMSPIIEKVYPLAPEPQR